MSKLFPKEFLWGAATAAHQVEGGNFNNDWWEFEQKGLIHDSSSSHPSCDHYNLYQQDIELLKKIGCNAYRFSIEWSRVEPKEEIFDDEEWKHYEKFIEALRKENIEPVLTLHHFTNPLWAIQKGGWRSEQSVLWFARFVEEVVKRFKGKVHWWITINEPNVYILLGYLAGYWPPQKKSLVSTAQVYKNMVEAHKKAYEIIHLSCPDSYVSIAHHWTVFDSWSTCLGERILTSLADWLWNRIFLESIRGYLDFVGLNYYTRQRIRLNFRSPQNFFVNAFPTPGKEAGFAIWENYPEGLLRALRRLKEFKLPVIITEYGMPRGFKVDPPDYLKEGIKGMKRALNEDVNVKGFFYWSLMDNFEWREGLSARFGLYEVDYSAQKRTLTPAGEIYSKHLSEIKTRP